MQTSTKLRIGLELSGRRRIANPCSRTGIRADIDNHEGLFNRLEEEIDLWESFQERVARGETVYPPQPATKRKRPAARLRGLKGRARDPEPADAAGADSHYLAHSQADAHRPLTPEDIMRKLENLRSCGNKMEDECNEQAATVDMLEAEVAQMGGEIVRLEHRPAGLCVQARNRYSEDRIKSDFAMGLREYVPKLSLHSVSLPFHGHEHR